MFPAQTIIRLDENKTIENIDNVHEESAQSVIGGIRIVGLLKQSQCLLTYALDMFHDLTDLADKMSQKVANIEKRTDCIRERVTSSISKYNNISDFWDDNEECLNEEFTSSTYKQFSLKRSKIVDNMISKVNGPPDLTKFNEIEIKTKDKKESFNDNVDFNNFFSDPQFFRRQYMDELVEQLKEEKEAKKKVIRQQKLKEKEEKKKRKELKKKLNEKNLNDSTISLAITNPPPAPSKLMMPPPKGQAHHEKKLLSNNITSSLSPKRETDNIVIIPILNNLNPEEKTNINAEVHPKLNTIDSNIHDENEVFIPPPPPPPPPSLEKLPDIVPKSISNADSNSKRSSEKSKNSFETPLNHIDLIKSGKFSLKPIDRTKPLGIPPKPKEPVDPSVLTIQELLQQISIIREQTVCSESSENEEESESSENSWT
ncbi:hypothetical protein M9Y10_014929 [Tritrichomonas musculus]|uniref:WH2 domain-containing protein n=1 Tax=Tritrichomonas musculus TaxID=1915356 RepID=A0ABR2L1B4_9EUKA